MRAAEAEDAGGRKRPKRWTTLPKVPKRTVAIAVVMVIVILLALLT
jgi:hypothetical protein